MSVQKELAAETVKGAGPAGPGGEPGSGEVPPSSQTSALIEGEGPKVGAGAEYCGAKGKGATPRRRHRFAFSFARRICALPVVRCAADLARSSYDFVKRSSRITEVVFSVAETGLKLATGPAALCAVPFCVALAVPICVADFGLNRALDAVEFVAPCVKYDFDEAKESAAKLGLRIITIPDSAAEAAAVVLDTCPGKVIVKAVQMTSNAAGKTFDVLIFCPQNGMLKDTVFLIPRLSWSVARRLAEAAENRRKALRDSLAAAAAPPPVEDNEDGRESLHDSLEKLAAEVRKS